jgi:hypothetical protein
VERRNRCYIMCATTRNSESFNSLIWKEEETESSEWLFNDEMKKWHLLRKWFIEEFLFFQWSELYQSNFLIWNVNEFKSCFIITLINDVLKLLTFWLCKNVIPISYDMINSSNNNSGKLKCIELVLN